MKIYKKLISITTIILFGSVTWGSLTVFAGEPILIDPNMQFKGEIYFPIEDPYTDDPALEVFLRGEIFEDGNIVLEWERYDGPDFQYYKIMHSQDNPDMVYPMDPELDFYEDQNRTRFIHEGGPLGQNFYRICVTTTTDKRGCSNPVDIFKEEFFEEPVEEEPVMEPEPEEKPEIEEPHPEQFGQKPPKIEKRPGFFGNIWKFIVDNIASIATIFAVIVAISGFTFAAKRKQRSISKYMNQIDDTYSEYKMKAKRCEAELYRLKDIIDDELKSGKLEDSAYKLLMGRIEGYMVDIQKQIVNEKFGGLPASLKDQLFLMMEDGEITESEFDTIQKLIKRSELSVDQQDSLLQTIKDFKKQDDMMKRRKK